MKKLLIVLLALILAPNLVWGAATLVDRLTNDHIEPLVKNDYIKATRFVASSTTATSTFAGGLQLDGSIKVNNSTFPSRFSNIATWFRDDADLASDSVEFFRFGLGNYGSPDVKTFGWDVAGGAFYFADSDGNPENIEANQIVAFDGFYGNGSQIFALNADNVSAGTLLTTRGGTGVGSWAQGDIPYYTSGTALSALAKNTSATRYLSNQGTSNAPSWNQVNLANGVTGTLPVANGGTGTSTAFTAGSVIFASSSGQYYEDNTNFFWNDALNRLELGATAPSTNNGQVFNVETTRTDDITANAFGGVTVMYANPPVNEGTFAYLADIKQAWKLGSFNITTTGGLRGSQYAVINGGTGTLSEAQAYTAIIQNIATGTIGSAMAYAAYTPTASAANPITTSYGMYIYSQKPTGVTTGYGVLSAGASDRNAFAGTMSIGLANVTDLYGLWLRPTIATSKGLVVQGITGQSGRLQEFQDIAGTVLAYVDQNGGAVFNENASSTADFRIEGDTDANLFFADASADNVGIGSSTPYAKLSVKGNSGAALNPLLALASSTNADVFKVNGAGHITTGGGTPTVSTCGTSPSISGNDTSGTVTVGTGVVTACTITFATPRATIPRVVGVVTGGGLSITGGYSAKSTTAVTFSFAATVAGGTFDYMIIE